MLPFCFSKMRQVQIAFLRRCSFLPSVSFWFSFETCRMADEQINLCRSGDHKATQIVKSWGCCKWYTTLAQCGVPLAADAQLKSILKVGSSSTFLRLCLIAWNWSSASQFWLDHGEHARHVRAWDVCDRHHRHLMRVQTACGFENWVLDPSRDMGKSTSWKWDDHRPSCRKQCGQAVSDQRLSPQPDVTEKSLPAPMSSQRHVPEDSRSKSLRLPSVHAAQKLFGSRIKCSHILLPLFDDKG